MLKNYKKRAAVGILAAALFMPAACSPKETLTPVDAKVLYEAVDKLENTVGFDASTGISVKYGGEEYIYSAEQIYTKDPFVSFSNISFSGADSFEKRKVYLLGSEEGYVLYDAEYKPEEGYVGQRQILESKSGAIAYDPPELIRKILSVTEQTLSAGVNESGLTKYVLQMGEDSFELAETIGLENILGVEISSGQVEGTVWMDEDGYPVEATLILTKLNGGSEKAEYSFAAYGIGDPDYVRIPDAVYE